MERLTLYLTIIHYYTQYFRFYLFIQNVILAFVIAFLALFGERYFRSPCSQCYNRAFSIFQSDNTLFGAVNGYSGRIAASD